MTASPIIQIDRASVRRDGDLILDDVSLDLFAGQPLAILGPNGCGKSTLIRLMTREIHPLADGGQVRWWGKSRWGQTELRSQISVVQPINPAHLLGDFTVRSMVVTGALCTIGVTEFDRVPEDLMEAAELQMDRLNIGHLANRTYATLSAGETQRVLIARALINRPRVLILDEPTNGLDFVARHHLLLELALLPQVVEGLVLVTHHFSEITDIYERVVLMQGGRVVADGRREEVLRPEPVALSFDCPIAMVEAEAMPRISV